MELKDAVIARRMASQFWGEIQHQKKIADGFWWFDTAGHGGYIADVNKYPKLANYKSRVYTNAKCNYYDTEEQHFAAFEEDCDWAVPMFIYPNLAEADYKKFERGREFYNKCPTVAEYSKQYIVPTILRWHNELIK